MPAKLKRPIYERIAPFERSGSLHRWSSPFLKREHSVCKRAQGAMEAAVMRLLDLKRECTV